MIAFKCCTGPRHENEANQLARIKGWHGKFGHLNVLTMDHDSVVTGYGKHDRVVTTLPQFDKEYDTVVLYARVDTVWGLGLPTPEQIIQVAKEHDNTKGDWEVFKTEAADDNTSHYFYFKERVAKPKLRQQNDVTVPVGTTHLKLSSILPPKPIKVEKGLVYFHMNGKWELAPNITVKKMEVSAELYPKAEVTPWQFDIENAPSSPKTTRSSYLYNGKIINHNLKIVFTDTPFVSTITASNAKIHHVNVMAMRPEDAVNKAVEAVEMLLNQDCIENASEMKIAYVSHQVLGRTNDVFYEAEMTFQIAKNKALSISAEMDC